MDSSQGLPFYPSLFKDGIVTPLFLSPEISPDCQDFSNNKQDCFGNSISQFPQDSRMHLSGSRRVVYIQFPQVGDEPDFPTPWEGLAPPCPILLSMHFRGVGKKGCQ